MNSHTYGILPTVIRHDQRVSDFACRLYSEIQSLSNKYGYCFATNEYLAVIFGKTPETISRVISKMQSLGYLSVSIENGYKRKMAVRMDFTAVEGVDENVNGGNQKDQGGLMKMSRGVDENVNHNKIIKEDKYSKIIEEEKGKAQSLFQKEIEELKKEYKDLPDFNAQEAYEKLKQIDAEIKASKLKIVSEVIDYLNTQAKTSFKATTKETMQFVLARQKVDGWELEDFKLVIDFKISQWFNDEKMRHNLNPSTLFRGVHAEKYLMSAKAWKESSKIGQNGQIRYSKEEKISPMKYDRVLPTPKLNKV
jgi:uncharacterized phage protein (TIGR02220 family)